MSANVHWKKLHNPNYLGSYSLDQDGKYVDMNVQIEAVTKEVVMGAEGKSEECIVARIKGNKPLILNATNCKTLAKLFNDPHVGAWTTRPVTLYVAKIRAFGETVDALRIRDKFPTEPVKTKEKLDASHPKWNGAIAALKAGSTTIEQIEAKFTIDKNEIQKALA